MKFTITEEEKKSIRGMYLLEQETSGTTSNKDDEIKIEIKLHSSIRGAS